MTEFGQLGEGAWAVAVQGDGRIVAVGEAYVRGYEDSKYALARDRSVEVDRHLPPINCDGFARFAHRAVLLGAQASPRRAPVTGALNERCSVGGLKNGHGAICRLSGG